MNLQDTIVASATSNTVSALGIIRLSGSQSINILNKIFRPKNQKQFAEIVKANTIYYGVILDNEEVIDEVCISVFLQPNSFTGENTIEITHHGSPYIANKILNLLISNGARLANKGEFSLRAFLNGKINLSQAEAIADLIQSDTQASHNLAINQLKGNYNIQLKQLRTDFLNISSLLELEIDFSAEQEVFVDRTDLENKLMKAEQTLTNLVNSFSQGNAFRKGIPIAIVGKPNAGKSTLMNALLNDNRSIVSNISGTTRDTIEEVLHINGIALRFIDTAGLHNSENEIEKQGIIRSYQAAKNSKIILYLIDSTTETIKSIEEQLRFFASDVDLTDKYLLLIINKDDISNLNAQDKNKLLKKGAIFISAKDKTGINDILTFITQKYDSQTINDKILVSNIRHYNAMKNALKELQIANDCLQKGMSSDIISQSIRMATDYIGQITGEITSQDILINIFSSFCIGK